MRPLAELKGKTNALIQEHIDPSIIKRTSLLRLLKNSADPIWTVNREWKLCDFNEPFRQLMTNFYGEDVFAGMDALGISDKASCEEWKYHYDRAMQGEYFTIEMKFNGKIEDRFFDVSFNPLIVNDAVEGVLVFGRDVSVHKLTERQLKYKVNELNTFMYKATHDLRSPLVSLMGLVVLAKEEASRGTGQLSEYFEMIGKSVQKMDNLLIDLVSITNVSQGKLVVNEIDFNKMTDDILESLSHHPNFENIRIRKMICAKTPFYNDDKLMYSVMQNLIDNAIKYCRTGHSSAASISIIVEANPQSVMINILDNGIGIEEKAQEKVFDMFYRAATTSSGTGLGLYIVKTAVEKMKGKISLASKQNSGTSVYITMPNLG